MRLQKILSGAGLCSRRTAETWLADGRVRVNGRTACVGESADPQRDEILVDGVPLRTREEKVYLMLNKPRGYVTTLSDERGRPTVAELVKDAGVRVFPVGRLDMDSEGLLLLTNDVALTQALIHPRFQVDKTYRVWVAGPVEGAAERLSRLTDLEGEPIRQADVRTLRSGGNGAELSIVIHEGKNRQIRRMCALCGLSVRRLVRVREDGLELGDLPPGKWRTLTAAEVAALRKES